MAVKHNNVLLNLITGCLYWLTTCFGQLHDHHQVFFFNLLHAPLLKVILHALL